MDSLSNQQAPSFVIANQQAEEAGFDFWGVLNRRKWLVFLGLITGLGLGGLYHAQCEELFESTANIKIEPKNPAVFNISNSAAMRPDMESFTTRHDRLIGQNNIIARCLATLKDLPAFSEIPEGEIELYVQQNLEITQDREEPVLYELAFTCNDPDDAQTVLNNLIATYQEVLEEQYSFQAGEYTKLLKQVQTKFNTEYAQLQKDHNDLLSQYNVPIINGRNLHEMAIAELGTSIESAKEQLSLLVSDRDRVNDALENGEEAIRSRYWILVNQKKISNRLSSEDDNEREEVERQIMQLDMQIDEFLSRGMGHGHPSVQSLTKQKSTWMKFLEGSGENSLDLMELDPKVLLQRFLLSTKQQINDQQNYLEASSGLYAKHNVEAARLTILNRKIEATRQQMDDVREFVNIAQKKIVEVDPSMELNNQNRNEGFRFDVLKSAVYGETVWPILPVILGIGGLLGILSGFGLGCLVELADRTFHNPDEIMKQLNIPLIGHIPVIGQSKRYLVENSLIEPIVCTYHRPRSQVSESFRAVRTALYFNTQGKQHSVIQITSPTPGDGKSTLASNLAVSIAQSGKRVLLVDGDMRRPRQGATFGITAKEGFATVLSGQSQWRDVVYECEEIDGLTVMPCGSKPNNPAELSSSPQVKELIEEMREEFDFVIIDTPPLLAVTDACPIAARVDGVVLCIRIKKNVRVSAERATEMMANLGANCIGLVVNGVGAQTGYGSQYTYGAYRAGYSYNGYGYGYGYGYGAGKYYEDDSTDKTTRTQSPVPGPPKNIEQQSPEQTHS